MLKSSLHSHTIALLLLVLLFSLAGCGASTTASEDTWGRANAKEIDVNSKIGGRVVELLVKEGDTVEKGALLARVDQRDLLAQKAQIEANIEAIRAQQVQAQEATRVQSGTTAGARGQAEAQQAQAQANLALAEADYARFEELVSSGAVSEQTFEQIRTKYQAAQAAAEQANQGVATATAAQGQTAVSRANESALAKKLVAAEAELQRLEVALSETEIRAPFSGVISAKYIEEGSMISMGTPLIALQDPADNWVDIKVPETELSAYHLHDTVELLARDGKTRVKGTITDISKKAEFATQRATSERGDATDIVTFNVKIQVNDEALRPGMRFRLVGAKS